MEEKKYVLTNETKQLENGAILHRIQAVINLAGSVSEGDLGGWIEKEENLSHEGTCWVYDDAMVYGAARVEGDAHIHNTATVCGNSRVYHLARIFDNVYIGDDAHVYGDTCICGDAEITEHAKVRGNVEVYGNAKIHGYAQVYGQSIVMDDAEVYDYANVYGISIIRNKAHVCGNARIKGSAFICSSSDYIVVGPVGSKNDFITFYRSRNNEIHVYHNDFIGALDKFKREVNCTYKGAIKGSSSYSEYKQYFSAIICAESALKF